ncbi:uncharacterized protein LOC104446277 [Eucalyptus grandis]|uniref:Uncharacterized protein n=2 Tax=Eucalyptus grandis TaxID=71139 RepID=A0ACC3M6M2_EUCGR|nr:uncharacterized protein LOC104446277 [Eucalyptus grandis]KAK3446879.1 hypothetical protein EUGRSUZ_A02505 [Eucalyptus grandis]
MSRLAPVSEEPIDEESIRSCSKRGRSWRHWLRTHLSFAFNKNTNHLKVLLSVLGCPLFPVSVHQRTPVNEVSSSAQYIVQHFTAATGCRKLDGHVKNVFVTGKVTMAMTEEVGPSGAAAGATAAMASSVSQQKGCFVMWQMLPDKWLIELVLGDQKVVAGSNGSVAWRHTPWLGAHTAKGSVRPLRRALQGLDPVTIAAVFSTSEYMGEKKIGDVDCFVLKLSADQADLSDRSDSTAETIKHVAFGYFSQKNGLLVYLEDSYLTRIQSPGTRPMYWETSMATQIRDYREVDGVMIAHSGQSSAIITRFGDGRLRAGPEITRLEETWIIDDFAFNVPGLSVDSFIPPKDVRKDHFPLDDDWKSALD